MVLLTPQAVDDESRLPAQVQSVVLPPVELCDRWGSFVYGLALMLTASSARAAEITYDVFMLAAANPVTSGSDERAVQARLSALTQDLSATVPAQSQNLPDAEQLALALARAASIRGAADGLHPQQRLAIALTHSGGQSISAAARVLGLSPAVVNELLRAGLAQLSTSHPSTSN